MKNAIQKANDVSVGTNNHTAKTITFPNDVFRELFYLYRASIAGKRISHMKANSHLVTVASTANLSKIRCELGIFINDHWVRKPKPEKSYKEFWLTGENIIKAERLLRSYGLI